MSNKYIDLTEEQDQGPEVRGSKKIYNNDWQNSIYVQSLPRKGLQPLSIQM